MWKPGDELGPLDQPKRKLNIDWTSEGLVRKHPTTVREDNMNALRTQWGETPLKHVEEKPKINPNKASVVAEKVHPAVKAAWQHLRNEERALSSLLGTPWPISYRGQMMSPQRAFDMVRKEMSLPICPCRHCDQRRMIEQRNAQDQLQYQQYQGLSMNQVLGQGPALNNQGLGQSPALNIPDYGTRSREEFKF